VFPNENTGGRFSPKVAEHLTGKSLRQRSSLTARHALQDPLRRSAIPTAVLWETIRRQLAGSKLLNK